MCTCVIIDVTLLALIMFPTYISIRHLLVFTTLSFYLRLENVSLTLAFDSYLCYVDIILLGLSFVFYLCQYLISTCVCDLITLLVSRMYFPYVLI